MPRDIVGHCEQLALHQFFRARRCLIARGIVRSQPLDQRRHIQGFFKIAHLAKDIASRFALRRSLLSEHSYAHRKRDPEYFHG